MANTAPREALRMQALAKPDGELWTVEEALAFTSAERSEMIEVTSIEDPGNESLRRKMVENADEHDVALAAARQSFESSTSSE